jgi:hypothetical protein
MVQTKANILKILDNNNAVAIFIDIDTNRPQIQTTGTILASCVSVRPCLNNKHEYIMMAK